MTTYVAVLRAVNVAGKNTLSMSDLRSLASDLGFGDARTLLQSGNLVFETEGTTTDRLENALEGAAKARLGLETDFFVRTSREWAEIISSDPFPSEAKHDPSHLVVMVMRDAPSNADVATLVKGIAGRERLRAKGKQLYIVYPDGIGRSKLTNALIEKKLSTRGTARNWNTVLKLRTLSS